MESVAQLPTNWRGWAISCNLNYHAAVISLGSNSKVAFAAHGIDRIGDEIGPHLIEFASKEFTGREIGW